MPFGKWATVTEASEFYGVTRQRIHQLIAKKMLGQCKLVNMPRGDVWLIPFPFARKVGHVGRPPMQNPKVNKERETNGIDTVGRGS